MEIIEDDIFFILSPHQHEITDNDITIHSIQIDRGFFRWISYLLEKRRVLRIKDFKNFFQTIKHGGFFTQVIPGKFQVSTDKRGKISIWKTFCSFGKQPHEV